MNDEVREMIGKALGGEPPIGIDYDSVRAAGRRRLVRRHVGIVGGAALAVVAVAGTAVAVGQLAAGPAHQPAGPPPTSVARPAPGDGCVVPAMQGGFTARPDGVASEAELVESARLTEAFGRFTMPLPPDVSMEPAQPRLCAIEESWGTHLTLRSPAGDRGLFLEVSPRAGQSPGECRLADGEPCAVKTLPDGTTLMISEAPPVGARWPALVTAIAWRPDGTVVRILETGSEAPNPTPRILTDEALAVIASAPELKVDWTGTPKAPPPEPSDRRAAELTGVLTKAMVLPAGVSARVDGMAFYVSQGGYKLSADLVDGAGVGHLFINLNPPSRHAPSLRCTGPEPCEQVELADGRQATIHRQSAAGITTLVLITAAADGTQVMIMASNQAEGNTRATRPEPPLGRDDLIRIASLAELRW
jgi:hypothetical protein